MLKLITEQESKLGKIAQALEMSRDEVIQHAVSHYVDKVPIQNDLNASNVFLDEFYMDMLRDMQLHFMLGSKEEALKFVIKHMHIAMTHEIANTEHE